MAGARMNKKLFGIGLIAVCVASFGWVRLLMIFSSYDVRPRLVSIDGLQSFSTYKDHDFEWYQKNCFGAMTEKLSISTLDDYVALWKRSSNPYCRNTYEKFSSIYAVNKVSGQIVVPETFQVKLLKWLGNNEELLKEAKLQFITTVYNQYTHESSIFNPLRSKRPGLTSDEDADSYIEELSSKTEKNCDLCEYKYKTAEDTFGRIESEHSVTAANAFKYDSYHALVMFKTHHPLLFSEEQFVDFMNTAMKWFMKVHTMDKQYRFPHLMWDSLPKASASQVHPHAQISLNSIRYYGLMEHIKQAGMRYGQEHDGQNYFSHLLQVHSALGLTTTLGNASAMAYITPKKDHEIFIVSKTPNTDFFRLLYYTIRAFIDDLHLYAWSLAMFLPELEPWSTPDYDDIPAIVRIITRGPPTSSRSDISGLELFGASNVNIDPFSVIQHIENSVKSRSQPQSEHNLKQQKIQQQIEELQQQLEQQKQADPPCDGESEMCKLNEDAAKENGKEQEVKPPEKAGKEEAVKPPEKSGDAKELVKEVQHVQRR
ncbi:uncharacterized protein [Amphiura filiformis]|uniref:uncharacterized protein n=1 Tax=Amphiura filiformis TaxID=82378 RepID=UPI003B22827A